MDIKNCVHFVIVLFTLVFDSKNRTKPVYGMTLNVHRALDKARDRQYNFSKYRERPSGKSEQDMSHTRILRAVRGARL